MLKREGEDTIAWEEVNILQPKTDNCPGQKLQLSNPHSSSATPQGLPSYARDRRGEEAPLEPDGRHVEDMGGRQIEEEKRGWVGEKILPWLPGSP